MRPILRWHALKSRGLVASAIGGGSAAIAFHRWQRPLKCDRPYPSGSNNGERVGGRSDSGDGEEINPLFLDDDAALWFNFSSGFNQVCVAISKVKWTEVGDKITDHMLPEWAQQLPAYMNKIRAEMEMKPGSLADEIWQEAQDPAIHPEIVRSAQVRIGDELCPKELGFVERRKKHTAVALAKYLDLEPSQVDPRDVPTIAICGSGGGLRALVSGASSYLCTQEAGLFGCATYTAGVSGSCWLQALYNSSLGRQDMNRVIAHLKRRIGTHIAYPPSFLDMLTRAPTNRYLLSGTVERLKGDTSADFGIVDVYGLLLGTRLLVPADELTVKTEDTKLSHQAQLINDGSRPLPIYAAVRHEIPLPDKDKKKDEDDKISQEAIDKSKQEAWFQWLEFTPYEFWCEEFGAGIPTWSVGRQFRDGRTLPLRTGVDLPELRMPFLMGIWGSAFCATLSHYYKEIRPFVKGLAGFGGIDKVLGERDHELIKLHPIEPGSVPNFARGMEALLPPKCPESIFKDDYLELMDAGMSNNLPIYPLLRKGRDVDIIVCFDSSADIKQENWLSVVDGYAQQRGLRGWPIGAGWPKEDTSQEEIERVLETADDATPKQAIAKTTEAAGGDPGINNHSAPDPKVDELSFEKRSNDNRELGHCNVWVGTSMERASTDEPPQSKRLEPNADWQLSADDAGITVIYFPFLPNDKVEGVNPAESDFMSTWNFIYTPEQIDKVVALAKANFEEGKEQTRRTVRAVYERKRQKRLDNERHHDWRHRSKRLRNDGNQFE